MSNALGQHKCELKVNDLSAGYGSWIEADRAVLRDVDMELKSGELVCLIGPNGEGKSTLLKALFHQCPWQEGQVELSGKSWSSWNPSERARIVSYMPQSAIPAFPYKVQEVVRMGRYPYTSGFAAVMGGMTSEDLAAVDNAIQQCGLEHLKDRLIDQLSGGEWQRALLARTLAQQTELLLLDEPTSNLDLGHVLETYQLLKSLSQDREQTRGILCITHDLNLAAEFADRILVLEKGEITASGRPQDVLSDEMMSRVFQASGMKVKLNELTGAPHLFYTGNSTSKSMGSSEVSS